MHFWDLILRQFNHAILRISCFCMRGKIPHWKLPWKSRCKNCKILRVSFQFICSLCKSPCVRRHGLAWCWCHTSRISKESCWRFTRGQAGLQKTFPDMPHESRLINPLGLRVLASTRGTTQSCAPFQDPRILWHHSGYSPSLVVAKF